MTEANNFRDDDEEDDDELREKDEDDGFYHYDVKLILYSAEAGLVIACEMNMPFVPDQSFKIVIGTLNGKKMYLSVGEKIWNKEYPLEISFCCDVVCKLKAAHDGKLARFKYGQIPIWLIENIMEDKKWKKMLPEDIYIADIVDAVDVDAYDPNSPTSPNDSQFQPKDSDPDDKTVYIG
jgi:hypothetical protein